MLKMMITCRRNSSMSRLHFFHHLRHVHWPLIQRHPGVLDALPGYVQNHTILPEAGVELSAPFKIAIERDSVIELAFDGVAGIHRLLSEPAYMQHIRPDEAHFNDLPHNIMVLANASTVLDALPGYVQNHTSFRKRALNSRRANLSRWGSSEFVIPGRHEVAGPESIITGHAGLALNSFYTISEYGFPGSSRNRSSGRPLRAGPVGSAPE